MAKKESKILNYFKDVKSELKKVVWPSFKQVKNNTLIVILCVVIVGIFIALLDLAFSASFGKIVDLLQGEEAVEETVDTETEMTQEEYDAAMMEMLASVGVDVDAETGKYIDVETKAELSEEEVNARLSAMLEAAGLNTEATTETNNAQ
ncbi:MAG: preprotein translocase subunit SecE [Clostridia bacterium]|nr:preprotein translocase subunit SecE [Clostridia bacterium]